MTAPCMKWSTPTRGVRGVLVRNKHGYGRLGSHGRDRVLRPQGQGCHPAQVHPEKEDPHRMGGSPAGRVAVRAPSRREGIKPHSYFSWTKEFIDAGKERLTRDSVRDATREEVNQLQRQNGALM